MDRSVFAGSATKRIAAAPLVTCPVPMTTAHSVVFMGEDHLVRRGRNAARAVPGCALAVGSSQISVARAHEDPQHRRRQRVGSATAPEADRRENLSEPDRPRVVPEHALATRSRQGRSRGIVIQKAIEGRQRAGRCVVDGDLLPDVE